MELFKKKRPPYLGVSGQRRLGQIIKERKDLYAGFSLEGIRRDLIEQTGGEISRMQMQLVWDVLEGAGVVPKIKYRSAIRDRAQEQVPSELLAKFEHVLKALKDLGSLEVPSPARRQRLERLEVPD